MSVRATIIMVILAAAAVTAAIWLARGGSVATRVATASRPLLAPGAPGQLRGSEVERITLQRASQPPLVFKRSGEGWTQTQPFRFPMDAFSIEQFIKLAAEAMVLEVIEPNQMRDEQSLASLGLDPPMATVSYESPTGSLAIDLGRRGVAGRAYARVDGDLNVYVIDHALQDRAASMDPKEWRDRRLFPDGPAANASGGGGEADEMLLDAGGQRILLRRDHKRWLMLAPARTRVDPAAIEMLHSALGRAVSSGFMLDEPDQLGRFGLDPPAGSLTITGTAPGQTSPQQQRLLVGSLIGAGGQDRFGIIEGTPVLIRLSAAVLAALFPSRESLVQPTATGALSADVKSIHIMGPGGDFILERDLDQWRAPNLGRAEVDRRLVEQLLTHLTELRATQVALEPFPRERQVALITLMGFSGLPLDTVRIARLSPDAEWTMDNGDNVQRRYPASMQLRLSPDEFGLQATPGSASGG